MNFRQPSLLHFNNQRVWAKFENFWVMNGSWLIVRKLVPTPLVTNSLAIIVFLRWFCYVTTNFFQGFDRTFRHCTIIRCTKSENCRTFASKWCIRHEALSCLWFKGRWYLNKTRHFARSLSFAMQSPRQLHCLNLW